MNADVPWRSEPFLIDPARPLYEQFTELMRSDIARGALQPGQRLPSVRELAAELRVNPNTVMRTYQDLERYGLIVSYRGQGTFVTEDAKAIRACRQDIAKTALSAFAQVAASLGLSVEELITLANSSSMESEGKPQ